MADLQTSLLHSAIRKEIRDNVGRRAELVDAMTANRQELALLLKKGKTAGLGVTEMATLAQVNRERASELIHDKAPRVTRGRPRKETQ